MRRQVCDREPTSRLIAARPPGLGWVPSISFSGRRPDIIHRRGLRSRPGLQGEEQRLTRRGEELAAAKVHWVVPRAVCRAEDVFPGCVSKTCGGWRTRRSTGLARGAPGAVTTDSHE